MRAKLQCVIPARLGATRLPNKPLALIGEMPLIVRTAAQAQKCKQADEVIVATDSAESIRRRAVASGCLGFLAGRDCLSAASSSPCPSPPIRCKAQRLAPRPVAVVGAEGRLLVTGRHRRLRRRSIVAPLQRPLARVLCRPAHASPALAQRGD